MIITRALLIPPFNAGYDAIDRWPGVCPVCPVCQSDTLAVLSLLIAYTTILVHCLNNSSVTNRQLFLHQHHGGDLL